MPTVGAAHARFHRASSRRCWPGCGRGWARRRPVRRPARGSRRTATTRRWWPTPTAGAAFVLTTDFFTPVVDDAYDWGRIAATNALSDIYAMGGRPVVAVNLLCWPRDLLPMELASEVLRGGLAVTAPGRLPSRRRAQRRRPGAEVRPRRDGRRRTGPDAAQRRRPARSAAVVDEEARHRRAQLAAQGDRRGLRPRPSPR